MAINVSFFLFRSSVVYLSTLSWGTKGLTEGKSQTSSAVLERIRFSKLYLKAWPEGLTWAACRSPVDRGTDK